MERCKHGLPIERACSECAGEALRQYPAIDRYQRMLEAAKAIFAPENPPHDEKESPKHG